MKETHDRRQQIKEDEEMEDEEPHRETAETKQLRKQDQLAKIVHRRVDPPTTLGEQHAPCLRSDGMSNGVGAELGLERGEMLH